MSRSYPERPRLISADEARRRGLGAIRGAVLAVFWSSLFWLLAVVLPIAWHNGWRP